MQVVGLRGGWHTAGTMAGVFNRLHGKRLAQAAEVIIELRAQGAPPARLNEGLGCMFLACAWRRPRRSSMSKRRVPYPLQTLLDALLRQCTLCKRQSKSVGWSHREVTWESACFMTAPAASHLPKAWAMPAPRALCAGL